MSADTLSNEIVLRGDDAARARSFDFLADLGPGGLRSTGVLAEQEQEAYDAARAEGHRDGWAAGFSEGNRAATDQVVARAEAAFVALERYQEALTRRVEQVIDRLQAEATNLAMEIAEAVLERELAVTADPGAEAIARCLELAPDIGEVVAHLNPTDVEVLGEIAGLHERPLQVVPDDRLDRGDAVVRVDDTLVDGRLASAMQRVAEVLR